jgi:hypothetical protein
MREAPRQDKPAAGIKLSRQRYTSRAAMFSAAAKAFLLSGPQLWRAAENT